MEKRKVALGSVVLGEEGGGEGPHGEKKRRLQGAGKGAPGGGGIKTEFSDSPVQTEGGTGYLTKLSSLLRRATCLAAGKDGEVQTDQTPAPWLAV